MAKLVRSRYLLRIKHIGLTPKESLVCLPLEDKRNLFTQIRHEDSCRSDRLHMRSIPHTNSFGSRLDVVTFRLFPRDYVDGYGCTTIDLSKLTFLSAKNSFAYPGASGYVTFLRINSNFGLKLNIAFL